MAKKKTVDVSSAPKGSRFGSYPMSEIFADHSWNARSGDWMQASGENQEEAVGFPGLVASIQESGLDTPITIRRNPKPNPAKGKEYLVVCGFRRYMACLKVAENTGEKNPMIDAFLMPEGTTEAQARALNGRENILRDDLKASDTAFVANELAKTGMKQIPIGLEIGKAQTYVGKLLRIMAMDSKVVEHWRSSPLPLPVMILEKLAGRAKEENMTAEVQWEEYQMLLSKKGSGPVTAADRANDAATKVGALLGGLHRAELIDCDGFDFEQAVKLGLIVKVKDDASDDEIAAIVKAAEDGFSAAVNPPKKPEPKVLKGAEATAPSTKESRKAAGKAVSKAN